MVDGGPLTLPERQLANEMAVQLAAFMWDHRGLGVKDGQIYNVGQSKYEGACRALNAVDVYRQGDHYTLHHVLVAVADVPAHMDALHDVTRAAFDMLLTYTLDNLVEYEILSCTRQPFQVAPALHRLALRLAGCGYATWDGAVLQWTDKPAPQMYAQSFWDKDGASLAEIEALKVETEAKTMLEGMLFLLRRKLRKALSDGDEVAAIQLMERHRSGERSRHSGRSAPQDMPMRQEPEIGVCTYRVAFRLLREVAA